MKVFDYFSISSLLVLYGSIVIKIGCLNYLILTGVFNLLILLSKFFKFFNASSISGSLFIVYSNNFILSFISFYFYEFILFILYMSSMNYDIMSSDFWTIYYLIFSFISFYFYEFILFNFFISSMNYDIISSDFWTI